MRKLNLIALLFSTFINPTNRQSYLYPVGFLPATNQLYLLYQSPQQELQLWLWEPTTQLAYPATLSYFQPACFQFLPDASGFSFIDHGLLRVKMYQKRLVRTVEFYAPLINLNSVVWRTAQQVCFCAQQADSYGIYLADLSQRTVTVRTLCKQSGVDYLFPQIVGDQLYCLARGLEKLELVSLSLARPGSVPISLLTLPNRAFKFLTLVQSDLGYCLEQLPANNAQVVSFKCHVLSCKNDPAAASNQAGTAAGWQLQELFKFDLPRALFSDATDNSARVVESLLPFLPRYTSENIWFCAQFPASLKDCEECSRRVCPTELAEPVGSDYVKTAPDTPDKHSKVNLYQYHCLTGKITKLTHAAPGQICCGILWLPGQQCYYGGTVADLRSSPGLPTLTASNADPESLTAPVTLTLDPESGLPKVQLSSLPLNPSGWCPGTCFTD